MIRIAVDGVTKKDWEKVKGFDVLHVETEDGDYYQFVFTDPKRKALETKTEDDDDDDGGVA